MVASLKKKAGIADLIAKGDLRQEVELQSQLIPLLMILITLKSQIVYLISQHRVL